MTPSEPTNCEIFEISISAMLDGELLPEERDVVELHLQQCKRCQRLLQQFGDVNQAVVGLSDPVYGIETVDVVEKAPVVVSPISTRRGSVQQPVTRPWAWAPIICVAALLLILFMFVLPSQKPVSAEQVDPVDLIQPIVEINRINEKTSRLDDLTWRTFGMDLLALKLKLKELDDESEKAAEITEQIDLMLEKVRVFASEMPN